jgi:tetratricopeptide (TPR) repeat protein
MSFQAKLLALVSLVGMLGSIFVTSRAHGAPASADKQRLAQSRALFKKGLTLFQRGEFAEAAQAWEAGYRLEPKPLFLYNAASAYRKAQNPEKALALYQAYLSAAPDAPEREEVTRAIDELRADEARKNPEEPPVHPLTEPEPGPKPIEEKPAAVTAKVPAPAATVQPTPALDLTAEGPKRTDDVDKPRTGHSRLWLWIGGATVVVAGSLAAIYFLVPKSAPTTDLGNYSLGFH